MLRKPNDDISSSEHVAAWSRERWIWSLNGRGRQDARNSFRRLHMTLLAPYDAESNISPSTLCQTSETARFIMCFNKDAWIALGCFSIGHRCDPSNTAPKV